MKMYGMGVLHPLSLEDRQRYFNWPPPPPPPPQKKSLPVQWWMVLGAMFLVCSLLSFLSSIIKELSSNPLGIFVVLAVIVAGVWFIIKRRPKQRPSMPLPLPIPTDEEYEAWVKSWLNSAREYGMQKLGLDERNDIKVDRALYVRSIVWPDSKDATFYQSRDCPVLAKQGLDGRRHGSVNRFTFFYPTEDYIAVFMGDVNALGSMGFERTRTYFYEDIVGVETSAFNLNNGEPFYVMQQFDLRLSSGQSISETVYVHDLHVFEETIQALRTLLKDKKQGRRGGSYAL